MCSRTARLVVVELVSDVSETIPVPIMMETKTAPETLDITFIQKDFTVYMMSISVSTTQ
jgi:hypothetical protein